VRTYSTSPHIKCDARYRIPRVFHSRMLCARKVGVGFMVHPSWRLTTRITHDFHPAQGESRPERDGKGTDTVCRQTHMYFVATNGTRFPGSPRSIPSSARIARLSFPKCTGNGKTQKNPYIYGVRKVHCTSGSVPRRPSLASRTSYLITRVCTVHHSTYTQSHLPPGHRACASCTVQVPSTVRS
jgi:hypothetical protein